MAKSRMAEVAAPHKKGNMLSRRKPTVANRRGSKEEFMSCAGERGKGGGRQPGKRPLERKKGTPAKGKEEPLQGNATFREGRGKPN